MRVMPKVLGAVAAGFLALGLGAGVAGAGTMPTPIPTHGISQVGSNSNDTYQKAKSKAETDQTNENIPLSFFAIGSNHGNVQQWNQAETQSAAVNQNWTNQKLDQGQDVTSFPTKSDCGRNSNDDKRRRHHKKHKDGADNKGNDNYGSKGSDPQSGNRPQSGDVSQKGSNDNSTKQRASSSAGTYQVNINAPISLFSVDSNNGNVSQGNQAQTASYASNQNGTSQNVGQGQAVANGNDGRNGDVSQSGSNRNSTGQEASSHANTYQENINIPISLFSVGSNDGNVHQGNAANTNSAAGNWNGTSQTVSQGQAVLSGLAA